MHQALHTLCAQFGLNNRLFRNVLEGVTDEQAAWQPDNRVNSLSWIAGHLTATRHRNLERIGAIAELFPYMDVFFIKDAPPPAARALDPALTYPDLEELRHYWDLYAKAFNHALDKMPEAQFRAELPSVSPTGGRTLLDILSFVSLHESYHIGQMSTLRRQLGLPPMSFR